jgi:hypothetical protein
MENIKEYIIDILDTDNIKVEVKDNVYHITKLFDAKKSDTLTNLFHLIKLTDKLTIESKLKTYLPEKMFKIYTDVINLPEPKIKVKKPSNYYDDLIGGVDNVDRFNTNVNIYRNTSFDTGTTITGLDYTYRIM